jgi:hypothetical protein
MKNFLCVIWIALFFTSCEKTVALKYKSNQSKIIIEGNISNGQGPYYVKVTKSINLTDTVSNPTINSAVVTIKDNAGNIDVLTLQGNGVYRTNTIVGVVGRTYTLEVKAESQTFTAQSTIPQQVLLDSIKFEQYVFGGEVEYNIIPKFTDPIGKGNNYRHLLLVNNKYVNQYFVQDDVSNDGFANSQRLELDDNLTKLKTGDLITVKMQCIDKNVALFYTTLALINDSGPGGGTTPSNPPNNISNGALGIFSAYTEQVKSKLLK